jgi:hypothetical protein
VDEGAGLADAEKDMGEEVKGKNEEDKKRRLAKKEAFAKMIIETDEPTEAEKAERVSACVANA